MLYFIVLVVMILLVACGLWMRYRAQLPANQVDSPAPTAAHEPAEPVDSAHVSVVTHDTSVRTASSSKATLIGLLILIPLGVFGVYWMVGSPQHLQPATIADDNTAQPPDVEALIAQLVDHLADQPNNPQGWFLLGRTYLKLGRYDQAVQALTTLHDQTPEANAKVALADALTLQHQGQIPPQAVTLLQQALQLKPDSVTTLWLLGQAAKQQQQTAQAITYWQRALPLLDTQPEAQQKLREQLAHLQSGAEVIDASEEAALSVRVTLDAAWQEKVSADDVLFVYAKAEQGPPMPLAVSRHKVADIPLTIQLTDSMAMLPQHTLSQFTRVRVGARISKTGQATAQSGDIQSAEVIVDQAVTSDVSILIDQLNP